MKRFLIWSLRLAVVVLVIVMTGAIWKWNDIQRLMAVNSLFDKDHIVENFSSMDRLFFHAELPTNEGPHFHLPLNPRPMPDLEEWIEARALTAIPHG